MLVVTRTPGEAIVLTLPGHPEISVYVSSVKGQKVRLAVDAPRSVDVRRCELPQQTHSTEASGAEAETAA